MNSLHEARDWIAAHADEGCSCPLCGQRVQHYRRKLNSTILHALVLLYRAGGSAEFQHGPTVMKGAYPYPQGDMGKLEHFGLVEALPEPRPDGGHIGWWRITSRGLRFLRGEIKLPKYAIVFDARVLRFEGEPVSVSEIDHAFHLGELLAGV